MARDRGSYLTLSCRRLLVTNLPVCAEESGRRDKDTGGEID